jgi:hypothetical protein
MALPKYHITISNKRASLLSIGSEMAYHQQGLASAAKLKKLSENKI